jgi:hypothetical protein
MPEGIKLEHRPELCPGDDGVTWFHPADVSWLQAVQLWQLLIKQPDVPYEVTFGVSQEKCLCTQLHQMVIQTIHGPESAWRWPGDTNFNLDA